MLAWFAVVLAREVYRHALRTLDVNRDGKASGGTRVSQSTRAIEAPSACGGTARAPLLQCWLLRGTR